MYYVVLIYIIYNLHDVDLVPKKSCTNRLSCIRVLVDQRGNTECLSALRIRLGWIPRNLSLPLEKYRVYHPQKRSII